MEVSFVPQDATNSPNNTRRVGHNDYTCFLATMDTTNLEC